MPPRGALDVQHEISTAQSSRSGLLPALSPLGTTRATFTACGSSLKCPTRHRVLLRNSCHHYSVKESRHRFSSKKILGFSRIPPSQLFILEFWRISNPTTLLFLLIHQIRSMASLLSTFSFTVWHIITMHPCQYNGLLNFWENSFSCLDLLEVCSLSRWVSSAKNYSFIAAPIRTITARHSLSPASHTC